MLHRSKRPWSGHASRNRLREGRLPELHAAKTGVDGAEAMEIAPLEDAGREVALADLDGLEVAEGEGAALPPDRIEQEQPSNRAFASLQLAKRTGSNVQLANDEPEKSVLRIVAA
jgi:hypothetical protein